MIFFFFFVFVSDMSQFGLSASNTHWGYSAATPYSSYLGSGALSSCGAGGFNTSSLGFTSSGDQSSASHDTFGSSSTVSSCKYLMFKAEDVLSSSP